jgi:MFS family permease
MHDCGGEVPCKRNSNYQGLLWARVFQGVGLAPFEALVNASVGDLYCVHERGKRMALSNLALFGGSFFTPVVVGKITHTIGWKWTFYFVAIFMAALLPLVFLALPETAYNRETGLDMDGGVGTPRNGEHSETSNNSQDAIGEEAGPSGSTAHGFFSTSTNHGLDLEIKELTTHHRDAEDVPYTYGQSYWRSPLPSSILASYVPPTWLERLSPWTGQRYSKSSYLTLLLRPFPLFFHPGILYSCLIQGTLIGWTVMIGIVLAAIMLGPPLFFNEVQTGYMYVGAFVGALVGFVFASLLADTSAKFLMKRNKGIWEPEFRLVLVVGQLVLGVGGLYGFGITSNNTKRYRWLWPDVFFGCEVAGMVIGAVASALYIVDAHRKLLLFFILFFFHTGLIG